MKYIRLFLLFCWVTSYSQTERFMPDSQFVVDYWHIPPQTELYVGASFFYTNPEDSIIVWCESSESDDIGNLYFMVPGYKDSTLFLFTNKQTGTRVNISKILSSPVSPGTEIFFMYSRPSTSNRRYTGQNRKDIDPENKIYYPGTSFWAKDFGLRPGYGHRWSVAGRIATNLNTLTDTIVFGFEDEGVKINPANDTLVVADFDFNDVIFKVRGLHLNIEKFPDSIAVVCNNPVIRAGDTALFRAEVWADSSGKKVRAPQYDTLVSWNFNGESVNHDTIMPGNDRSQLRFLCRTAYKQFTIGVSIFSPLSHDTLKAYKKVIPEPGPINQLSIELIADTSTPGFSFNQPVQISRVQLSSNTASSRIYAILRDLFGNYAGPGSQVLWDTTTKSSPLFTRGICTITNGDTSKGQGIINRATGSGNILVYAYTVLNQTTFSDTITASVASVSYDSIRISTGTVVPPFISSLLITTDNCTSLVAIGRRVDNQKWEPIQVLWSSPKWIPAATVHSDSLFRFCPTDTGTGFIEIVYQSYLRYRLPVTALPGTPSSTVIYLNNGSALPDDTTFIAGKAIGLTSYIFDKRGVRLKEQALSDSTIWQIIEKQNVSIDDSTGKIVSTKKLSLEYFPKQAYRTIQVKSSYGNLIDSGLIRIGPGAPYRVVIESHANPSRSLNAPSEINTIEIPDNRTRVTVFAIVRDSLGNYIDSLRNGTWGSTDTIVTVSPGSFAYEGTILKNLSVINGSCKIFVTSGNFSDSASVTLLPYHYVDLEISTPDYYPLSLLTISTNDDTTLITRGLRSDTALWKNVSSDWSVSDSISIFPSPPTGSVSYSFSPIRPRSGEIIAHIAGTDDLYDTIQVNFTRGKPVRSEIIITTPHEKIIAGDSISAVVKIYNKDGLVPGQYCFNKTSGPNIRYGDVLGYGKSGYSPVVISDEGSSVVNVVPLLNSSIDECFTDGIDTIHFVLYYAPASKDSLHRIVTEFDTILSFSSTFRLKPSALNSLKLAHTLPCCEDSITLRHLSDQVLIYSVGYDLYGNMRGSELCNWTVNGTLHSLHDSLNISRVLYESDPDIVIDDESGYIHAYSLNAPAIEDSLYVFVLGPRSNVTSAVTNDANGNGLLDKITIRFDRPVYLESALNRTDFHISYRSTTFPVDSLTISTDNRTMSLFLHEEPSPSMQTAWTPQLIFDNSFYSLIKAPDTISVTTTDGAGPVIESIVKEIKDNNRKNDLITVTFSERISGPSGTVFSVLQMPEKVFNTWRQVKADSMQQLSLLSGISGFNGPLNPNQLFFNTTNAIELTNNHYFNIRTDSTAYVLTDRYNNTPHINNRKVNVEIRGNVVEEMKIFPNPGRATDIREPAGDFHIEHNPQALDWVAADKAGIVMQFLLKLPENLKSTVKGQITICDAVGNVVCADPGVHYRWKNIFNDDPFIAIPVNKEILPAGWSNDGTIYHYYVYWNGYTQNKNRVAPGIYKVVLKVIVETEGATAKPVIYSGILGIKP
jgi:hypothetical protein